MQQARSGMAVAAPGVRLIVGDATPAVEGDLAALLEESLELVAAALHTGLHPGDRQADAGRGVGLGNPVDVGELECVAVDRRQLPEQWGQAAGELATLLVG